MRSQGYPPRFILPFSVEPYRSDEYLCLWKPAALIVPCSLNACLFLDNTVRKYSMKSSLSLRYSIGYRPRSLIAMWGWDLKTLTPIVPYGFGECLYFLSIRNESIRNPSRLFLGSLSEACAALCYLITGCQNRIHKIQNMYSDFLGASPPYFPLLLTSSPSGKHPDSCSLITEAPLLPTLFITSPVASTLTAAP